MSSEKIRYPGPFQTREVPLVERDGREVRNEAVLEIQRYLQFVPIGSLRLARDRGDEKGAQWQPLSPKDRAEIIGERGHRCEGCREAFKQQEELVVHHMNYYQQHNPDFLAVLCKPCHHIVGQLTNLVSQFEERARSVVKPELSRPWTRGNLVLSRRAEEEIAAWEKSKRRPPPPREDRIKLTPWQRQEAQKILQDKRTPMHPTGRRLPQQTVEKLLKNREEYGAE